MQIFYHVIPEAQQLNCAKRKNALEKKAPSLDKIQMAESFTPSRVGLEMVYGVGED